VRRGLKQKGIKIPSAEQVWKATEENPPSEVTDAAFKLAESNQD